MSVILSVLSMIVCPTANGMEVRAGDRPEAPLTVEQTLGAVFLGGEKGPRWNVFSRANPKAKSGVYEILKNKELEAYHSAALRLLGYIGEAEDVEFLRRSLEKDFSGVLSHVEKNTLTGIFDSLGIMARRGVKNARDLLDRMTAVEYWRPPRFQWFPDSVDARLPPEYETLARVIVAYARSEQQGLDKRIDAVLQTIEDPEILREMRHRIDPKRMSDIVKEMKQVESEPITPYLYEAIENVFDGDVENPGPAPKYRR